VRGYDVSADDLQWWFRIAETLEWKWAKTYEKFAPHSYIVLGKTPGLGREDFIRAGAVIRTFGHTRKFWKRLSIYLETPDDTVRYWTMDDNVLDTDLVNMTTELKAYGPQNAPSTETGTWTIYDGRAAFYEYARRSPGVKDAEDKLRTIVRNHFGETRPTILDVGAGTGAVMDLKLTWPENYTAVDPSKAMLNQLLVKHGTVTKIVPSTFEDAIDIESVDGQYDLVVVAGGSGSYLTRDAVHELPSLVRSGGLLVVTTYGETGSPYYANADLPATMQEAAAALGDLPRTKIGRLGAFDALVWRRT
jgi:hypothetical protein